MGRMTDLAGRIDSINEEIAQVDQEKEDLLESVAELDRKKEGLVEERADIAKQMAREVEEMAIPRVRSTKTPAAARPAGEEAAAAPPRPAPVQRPAPEPAAVAAVGAVKSEGAAGAHAEAEEGEDEEGGGEDDDEDEQRRPRGRDPDRPPMRRRTTNGDGGRRREEGKMTLSDHIYEIITEYFADEKVSVDQIAPKVARRIFRGKVDTSVRHDESEKVSALCNQALSNLVKQGKLGKEQHAGSRKNYYFLADDDEE